MASLKDVQVEKNRRTRKDQRFRTSNTHSCREKEQDKAGLEELLGPVVRSLVSATVG